MAKVSTDFHILLFRIILILFLYGLTSKFSLESDTVPCYLIPFLFFFEVQQVRDYSTFPMVLTKRVLANETTRSYAIAEYFISHPPGNYSTDNFFKHKVL